MKLDLRLLGNRKKDKPIIREVFHEGRWISDYDYLEKMGLIR